MLKFLTCLALLILTSCVDFPNQYAPRRARRPDNGPDPRGLKPYIDMKDPASLSHFAWGISLAAFDGEKRKAEPKAALRFRVDNTANLKLSVDYVSPQPQTTRFKLNGRLIGETTDPGHFESPVEASDFVPNTATLLEIETEAGLKLFRAGLLPR